MKLFFFIAFILLSIQCQSQQYVSREYIDSLDRVEKGYIGKTYPHFQVTDINGNAFSTSALPGKITLINFWFEGCHPCVAEFEPLNKLFERFHADKNFNFITFTFENPATINEIIKKYSLQFPVISISEEECHRLNFGRGFPTNIIVNTDGTVAFIKSGGPTNAVNATSEIDSTILPKLIELLNKN